MRCSSISPRNSTACSRISSRRRRERPMAARAEGSDAVTRTLHTALATAVVIELALQAVMRVPPGIGQGLDDWNRQAFELHSHFGPVLTLLCVLYWAWICLPVSRPGVAQLFPWRHRARRAGLKRESLALLQRRLPLHGGAGLLTVTASVVGGTLSYLGYYTRVPVPGAVLHWASLELVVTSWLVWAFVIGHVSMAVLHRIAVRMRA